MKRADIDTDERRAALGLVNGLNDGADGGVVEDQKEECQQHGDDGADEQHFAGHHQFAEKYGLDIEDPRHGEDLASPEGACATPQDIADRYAHHREADVRTGLDGIDEAAAYSNADEK